MRASTKGHLRPVPPPGEHVGLPETSIPPSTPRRAAFFWTVTILAAVGFCVVFYEVLKVAAWLLP